MSNEEDRLTADRVGQIAAAFIDSELEELSIEAEGLYLYMSRGRSLGERTAAVPSAAAETPGSASAQVPAPAGSTEPTDEPVTSTGPAEPGGNTAPEDDKVVVTAPSVGVFYRRPAPEKPAYVQVGDRVEDGAPLCTLEVMKMFSEVVAPQSGVVDQILVEDGEMVEHSQPLMYLNPTD